MTILLIRIAIILVTCALLYGEHKLERKITSRWYGRTHLMSGWQVVGALGVIAVSILICVAILLTACLALTITTYI